jgi:hypothetical protein
LKIGRKLKGNLMEFEKRADGRNTAIFPLLVEELQKPEKN